MTRTIKPLTSSYDAIVVGGGHNGLVATAYLAKAGLRVLLLEKRETLGGPCGNYEFMPGYRCALANSPGSFEPRILSELQLDRHGLKFVRTDPTVVHPFPAGAFIGWRDRSRIAEQLNAYSPGEADRYFGLMSDLEELGRHLGASIFTPSPQITEMARSVPDRLAPLFERVTCGSLRHLLDERLRSEEAKALLGMLAINAGMTPPSAPGSAFGLMMRPISLASYAATDANDPRNVPLRGSTGLPVGGMAAIIDALEACCVAHGAHILKGACVSQVLHRAGQAVGVTTEEGREYHADTVLSAISPTLLFRDLLDDEAVGEQLRAEVAAIPMRGSAFKLVLALDGLPQYRGLPHDVLSEDVATVQLRIAPTLDYIEKSIADGLAGRLADGPIMWGLMVSATAPQAAPAGRHLLSVNAWHAPYNLREGTWPEAAEQFANTCVDTLSQYLPDIRRKLVSMSWLDPTQIESEIGLVNSNITHGEMLPGLLLGGRPHSKVHDYRTPLRGLYLSGSGSWPGGYVTGLPGFNSSRTILNDIQRVHNEERHGIPG